MKLDPKRKITKVFGRAPLCYLQDGFGFDAAERYLGRFNAQGEQLDATEPGDADSKGEGEGDDGQEVSRPDVSHIRPKVGEEAPAGGAPASDGSAEAKTETGSFDAEALTAELNAKGVRELKTLAADAGIAGATGLNKAALVEALVEHASQGESAA
ncbi:MAG: hypothetical protein ACQEUM_07295 [Pseudomonadota bacterium]